MALSSSSTGGCFTCSSQRTSRRRDCLHAGQGQSASGAAGERAVLLITVRLGHAISSSWFSSGRLDRLAMRSTERYARRQDARRAGVRASEGSGQVAMARLRHFAEATPAA